VVQVVSCDKFTDAQVVHDRAGRVIQKRSPNGTVAGTWISCAWRRQQRALPPGSGRTSIEAQGMRVVDRGIGRRLPFGRRGVQVAGGLVAGRQELVHFLRESIIGACIGSLLSWWLVSGFSVRGRIRGAEWVGPVTPIIDDRGVGPVRRRLGMRWAITVRAWASSCRARCEPKQ
jgi:hypothetical protein